MLMPLRVPLLPTISPWILKMIPGILESPEMRTLMGISFKAQRNQLMCLWGGRKWAWNFYVGHHQRQKCRCDGWMVVILARVLYKRSRRRRRCNGILHLFLVVISASCKCASSEEWRRSGWLCVCISLQRDLRGDLHEGFARDNLSEGIRYEYGRVYGVVGHQIRLRKVHDMLRNLQMMLDNGNSNEIINLEIIGVILLHDVHVSLLYSRTWHGMLSFIVEGDFCWCRLFWK